MITSQNFIHIDIVNSKTSPNTTKYASNERYMLKLKLSVTIIKIKEFFVFVNFNILMLRKCKKIEKK